MGGLNWAVKRRVEEEVEEVLWSAVVVHVIVIEDVIVIVVAIGYLMPCSPYMVVETRCATCSALNHLGVLCIEEDRAVDHKEVLSRTLPRMSDSVNSVGWRRGRRSGRRLALPAG